MKLDYLKDGLSSLRDSLAEGWQRLRETAAGSLTRFSPKSADELPPAREVDDHFYFPSAGWSLLSGNVYEDEAKIVVRLEIPGLKKDDLKIEVHDRTLLVSGEKRFERESGEGRYRSFQCAYGAFQRSVALPASVLSDRASASYRDGILKIELPKEVRERPRRLDIQIE